MMVQSNLLNTCFVFKKKSWVLLNLMQVDASLSFLDGFVAEGLSQGAAPYKPHHQRQEEQLSQEKGIFSSLYHQMD